MTEIGSRSRLMILKDAFSSAIPMQSGGFLGESLHILYVDIVPGAVTSFLLILLFEGILGSVRSSCKLHLRFGPSFTTFNCPSDDLLRRWIRKVRAILKYPRSDKPTDVYSEHYIGFIPLPLYQEAQLQWHNGSPSQKGGLEIQ
jgi:hypothetical protein